MIDTAWLQKNSFGKTNLKILRTESNQEWLMGGARNGTP